MNAIVAALAAGCLALVAGGRRSAPRVQDLVPLTVAGCTVALISIAGQLPWSLVVLGGAFGLAGLQATVRRRRDRERETRSEAVIALCDGLAADLRAGVPPVAALGGAAREWPNFRCVLDTARLGGDVPTALRELARLPGAGGLDAVAAAWVVSHRSGAPLASAVALTATSLRADRATARVVATEMAAARATARLLAVLPVGVLVLGRGSGGDPFAFLLQTSPGTGCLTVGLGLEWLGLTWLDRIARSVRG